MPSLREQPEDLFALVGRASEELGLPLEFVEKDFWITELLRSVARPMDDARVVFKGGTSLSKAFRLIERFSEDVDILVVITRPFSKDFGKGSVDKILKLLCSRAGTDLGIDEQVVEGSGKGEHRDVRFGYAASVTPTMVQPGVLLEMGVRGGPKPSSRRQLRSLVGEHAIGALGVREEEYEELRPVEVEVLAPERTLFEKLAILHHHASNYPASEQELRRAARHLYDVHKLLTNADIRGAIEDRPRLGEEMASDIDSISEKWGWAHTPRPAGGYATSPVFDASHPCQEALSAGWILMQPLIYGDVPTMDQCRRTATQLADIL